MSVEIRLDRIEPCGRRGHCPIGNGIRNRDLEQSSGPAGPIEADFSTVMLDNIFRDCEAQSVAFGLSVAHKWSKDQFLNHWRDAGAVIPDTNLHVGGISVCGNHDLPRIWRNGFAGILDEVSDGSFKETGIEPAYGQTIMMMLDCDAPEFWFHTRHPDRTLDDGEREDVADPARPEGIRALGVLQQ